LLLRGRLHLLLLQRRFLLDIHLHAHIIHGRRCDDIARHNHAQALRISAQIVTKMQ
jgi:hypothetical protein